MPTPKSSFDTDPELFEGSLFQESSQKASCLKQESPLATRFRPRELTDFVGQEALLGEGKPLRRWMESGNRGSILLYGPPGVGKTSLAEVMARHTKAPFERFNAVDSTVADLRKVLRTAQHRSQTSGRTTFLFLDEIHRFNKAQQDVLLPEVESGAIRLIGATTHNPSFYLIGPLISRSHLFELKPLEEPELDLLIDRALNDEERGLGKWNVELASEARAHLRQSSEGDARRLLNGLEFAVLTTPPTSPHHVILTLADMEACLQKKRVLYDRNEDQHYDTISALIKSVRGSDPDAAIYWLAKMVEAGEDPRFLARRLVLLASEDIGLADPRAIMVAVAVKEAVEFIGMPEARIPLAEATLYLATAPKSNRAYQALNAAQKAVRQEPTIPIPSFLRSGSDSVARRLGDGEGYLYSHNFPEGISGQSYGITSGRFYQPSDKGYEKNLAERLLYWKKLRQEKGQRLEANNQQKK